MKKDGSEKELVYSFKEDYPNMTLLNMSISGRYIYGLWIQYNENGVHTSSASPNGETVGHWGYVPPPGILIGSILRIDMTTGEHYYHEIYT